MPTVEDRHLRTVPSQWLSRPQHEIERHGCEPVTNAPRQLLQLLNRDAVADQRALAPTQTRANERRLAYPGGDYSRHILGHRNSQRRTSRMAIQRAQIP